MSKSRQATDIYYVNYLHAVLNQWVFLHRCSFQVAPYNDLNYTCLHCEIMIAFGGLQMTAEKKISMIKQHNKYYLLALVCTACKGAVQLQLSTLRNKTGAEEGPRKMFNSILTFLTRKGISKASRSQTCLRGTWYCKKFNIRTSEWLHLGHPRATVLRSLSRTDCNSREKRCERQGRTILPSKTSWHRPLAHGEWSLTLLNGGDGFEDGAALIPEATQFSGTELLPSPKESLQRPGRLLLTLILFHIWCRTWRKISPGPLTRRDTVTPIPS